MNRMMKSRFVGTLVFLFVLTFLSAAQVIAPVPYQIRQDSASSPVVLQNDTLFYISQPVGIYSAAERAKRINVLLKDILVERETEVDSFKLMAIEQNYYIFYKDLPIMAIYPHDTAGIGISQFDLAQINIDSIKQGFRTNSPSYNLKVLTKNILNTSIIILLVIAVVILLNWIFRKFLKYLDARKEKYFKGWSLRNYLLFSSDQQFRVIRSLLFIIKIGLIILVVFIALPIIFTLFPETESITRKLINLIWSPVRKILLGIVAYIPKLITIIIIYFVFRYIIKGLKFLANEVEMKKLILPGFYPEWARPTFTIFRFILYVFMFILIFPLLPGSDSAIFQGVSIFVGLLISIGSSSAIANAVAGIVITYMRPFKIGDRIKIDDITGDVIEKSALVTRVRTIKNEDITIPNARLLTSFTVNYSAPAGETGLIIHTTVTIGYDAPWRKVHKLLIDAAIDTTGVLKNPGPFVLQTSLDDFYISYQLNAYIGNANKMLKIKSDLHQNIQDSFNRGGVEIMSPHYRSERDGTEVTIPKDWEEDSLIDSTHAEPEPPVRKKQSPKSKKN